MTRGWRFLVELALLPVLYLVSLPDPTLFTNAIYVIAFVAVPTNGTVAAILIWSSRKAPGIETLREHADDAATLFLMSLATAGASLLSILLRLGFQLPGRPTLVVLAWLAILIAVPALSWLGTWQRVWMPIVRGESPPDDDGNSPTG